MSDRARYDLLLDAVREGGDSTSDETALLLWFMREVMQVKDLDEYEVVMDDPESPIDGLLLERPEEAPKPILHLFECKLRDEPFEVDREMISAFGETVARFAAGKLTESGSRAFRNATLALNLSTEPLAGVELRPTLVVGGTVSPKVRSDADALGIVVYELDWLTHLAQALRGPGLLTRRLPVRCPRNRRFCTTTGAGELAVCEVRARDLAQWPGIDDRTLFGLNVRGELRQNKVRSGLDEALHTPGDHDDFIAYHNGLTVLCEELEYTDDEVIVTNLSVVNGAQSLLAFHRNRELLRDSDARVIVKFVAFRVGDMDFPTEVARRSNSQTAVNPRNLRANDPIQVELVRQFASCPDYSYVVKPDATRQPPGDAITNDDAAQWLCAIYQERPWLAVKRTELFRDPNYGRVFNADVTAAHIVLARRIWQAVQDRKVEFPDPYTRAWRLTTIMAIYLVGQALRAAEETAWWVEDPAAATQTGDFQQRVMELVSMVAETMRAYHKQRLEQFGNDDFKVDFKRENTAVDLARRVAKARRSTTS